ncbi:MAG: ATP-binding cassette domain-containing protein [Chthoniobacterales bacterium]|jgi:phospholipid/cholesterol/gamma-HCH transport system ATP-binding protein|nr:ATP-binding cassette domain-containing protein [Chthoniobacterales bacterium]
MPPDAATVSSSSSASVILEVGGLRKSFGQRAVLCGIGFAVTRGSLFTVLGPSGAGKSVLLKCLANIDRPDAGEIRFDGRTMDFRRSAEREAFHRRCSFLFQGNALFDSLTALENVALPLEQTTALSRADIHRRSMEALTQLELDEHAGQYPAMLSGGMQKRLALARAIVTRPEMVFFDEPTAGLDPLRRNAVFAMIAKYQKVFGFTALIVTHDVPEALAASCVVALLYRGEITFCGTPAEFSGSSNPVVASFRDSNDALRSSLAAVRRGEDIGGEPE